MPAQVTLKALGIISSPNSLALPPGALSAASNVVLKRGDVLEQRRGFKLYGTQAASLMKQLFTYKTRILRHFGSTLQFDSEVLNANDESIFNSFAGSFVETESGLRIKSVESNGNLYFTTADGIKKISAANPDQLSSASGYITNAGGVKAINGSARIDLELGQSNGFLPEDSAVAYRFVWGINDANNNLILGTPSERVVLYNSLLNFLIPDFDRVLGALDDITTTVPSTALIGAGGSVATTSAANPTIVTTTTPHTLTTKDLVVIYGTGVATIDGLTHEVTVLTATTFSIPVLSPGSAGGTWYYSYVENFTLASDASSTDVKNALIALAERIDKDILYANFAATAPMGIVSSIVASTVATITLSGADARTYWSAGSKIFLSGFAGAASGLNGAQTVVGVTATTVTFNTTATVPVTAASGNELIYSYEYRNAIANIPYQSTIFDLNTTAINNPATNNQLNILQGAISEIIARLGDEPVTVLSQANKNAYTNLLDVTTSTNVILTINIPESVNSNYFLQIYRSDIAQATGITVLADLTPNDEMQLVYEAFPTPAELAAGFMIVLDEVSDEFAGANLYTNPATGEGILQANDVPPLSKDINRFKNVVFYANTATRQRLNLNLAGVTNFKAGNITSFTAGASSVITTDLPHDLLAGDIVYINGTGVSTLDSVSDTNLHKIIAITPTTFTVPASGGAGGTVGYWTNSMIAFVDSVSARQYYFIKEMAETTNIATVAGVAGGDYFNIYSGKDEIKYYVWYKVSGSGTEPTVSGAIGILVNINPGESANIIATKTRDTLSRYSQDFLISGTTNNVIITNVTKGVTTNASDSGGATATGFTFTFTQQGRGENASIREVLLSTFDSPAQAADATSRSLQNVVNKTSTENTYIYYLSGLSDVPGKMLVEGRSLADGKFYIIANNSSVGDSFDPSITPTNFILTTSNTGTPTVITTTAPHDLVSNDQAVIAFTNSSALTNGLFTVTNLSFATNFSIDANVTVSGTSGALINAKDAVFSDNEVKINRVYYSKLNQPEAVPLLNYFDVGSQENAILRIFPLRDSLFVFKENEGLYRISGESAPFNLALFDSTCSLIAPDSVSPLNNQLFAWTDEGISAVSEAGVDNMSRDIDNILLKIGSSAYPNFSTATWGVGYHSDQAYIVYTNSMPTDTVATIGYRYNLETSRWTSIDKTTTCGVLNSKDDRLYMGAGDLPYIEQERKSFERIDYADRQWVKSIAANSFFDGGKRIKLSSVSNTLVGDVLVQEQYVTVVNFNSLLAKLDLDANVAAVPLVSISTGASPTITVKNLNFAPGGVNTVTDTITITAHGFLDGQKVRFISSGTLPVPLTANTDYLIGSSTANTFKLFDLAPAVPIVVNLLTTGSGTHTVFRFHNLVAGDFVTLNGTNGDPNLDGTHQVISTPSGFTFTITPSNPITTAGTTGMVRYNYSMSQEMVGGDDIRTKIVALANKLDTDPGTQFKQYFNIIDIKSGSITSNTATNPTVITSFAHELQNGRYIAITGTNSTPTFDGNYAVTFLSANTFSVPVSIQIAGNAGSWTTLTSDFRDLQAVYNAIISNLNLDPGVVFNNYQLITSTTLIESLITAVNTFTNEVSLAPGINFLVGSTTVYNAIESIIQYTPQTMEDPLGYKHMTNFTMMFENKAFTEAVVSFASDLLPEFIEVPFTGDGNGIFGYQDFGSNFFGGGSHGAPFRTYFPRQVMRCRYFLVRFKHKIARESYALLGITAEGSISQSSRAYRR